MRCRACDSLDATYQQQWEEWYCRECLEEIYDTLSEFEDDDFLEEFYDIER